MTLAGAGNSGSLLAGPAGFYWHDGTFGSDSARHDLSNYSLTTKFADNATGDESTFESATGPSTGICARELSSSTSLSQINLHIYSDPSYSWSVYVWDGSSYQTSGWAEIESPGGPPDPGTSWRTVQLSYSGSVPTTTGYLDYVVYLYAFNELSTDLKIGDIRRF